MELPYCSVIIPVKDGQGFIAKCLEQLIAQTYPADRFEILVVDGMSSDETRKEVEEVAGKNNSHLVRIIDNPKGHRASALNIGVKASKGNVIVRVDARTIIPKDYIEKCIETLLETHADNVGGMQVPLINQNGDCRKEWAQRAAGIALSHPFGVGNAQFRIGKRSGFVDTVYLGCFKKEIFKQVGFFDEDAPVISEDSDMNYRIRKAGGKVYFNKDIVAYYYPRDNFRDLARLYFRYGGAKAGNFLKIKKLTAWRQLVPPLFLVSIIILGLASIFSLWAGIIFFSIIGVYLLIDLFVSLNLTMKEKQFALFHRLFIVFPLLHFPWAAGFFVRLIQRPRPGTYWGY